MDADRTDRQSPSNTAFLYLSIRDLLAGKIAAGEFEPGTLLKEARISAQLGVSRAPVRRALALLADAGAIHSATGQGFIVGRDDAPVRITTRRLNEVLTVRSDDIERSAASERIFARVLDEVTACMPFGTYRIHEAQLANHHRVSRTVAREVLWRLMDRRLIEKSRKSHWIVGQLTARDLRETLEMRILLEPRALGHVAAGLGRDWLAALASRIDAMITGFPGGSAAELAGIERAMFQEMYDGLRNSRLRMSIRRNQTSLLVPRFFRAHFPMTDDLLALQDYAGILRSLRAGEVDRAQARLRDHLIRVEPLTLARLRVLSLLPPPNKVAYLMAVD